MGLQVKPEASDQQAQQEEGGGLPIFVIKLIVVPSCLCGLVPLFKVVAMSFHFY